MTGCTHENRDVRRETRAALAVFALLLLALNIPWDGGSPAARWTFHPASVRAGEWWRVLTGPFAHVGPYHLLLDGSAFLSLYAMLGDRGWKRRLGLVAAAHAGSLAAAWAAAPGALANLGLCGLSGIAHGLMGAAMLDFTDGRRNGRTAAWLAAAAFAGLAAKCAFEAAAGRVFFASMHLGGVGIPLAASHAGGLLGALAAFAAGRLGTGRKPAGKLKNVPSGGGRRRTLCTPCPTHTAGAGP